MNYYWPIFASLLISASMLPTAAAAPRPALRCNDSGTFKVMMYSDVQDGPNMDPRATALMEKLLDAEKPDIVIVGGDCIAGDTCKTPADLKKAIGHVAYPVEKRNIPWAIVFGNHDQEHFANTKLGKEAVIEIYRSFPHNLNVRGPKNIFGVGNDVLLITDSAGEKTVFGLWLIDSNEYVKGAANGYDWIHQDQIAWYVDTSKKLEAKNGRKIPGLMFFHIPLREFSEMTAAGKFKGDREEPECPARVNSGMLAAILERGDVKGVFCGHDHVNNYVGEWLGVQLGYDASITYYSYNLPETSPKLARGRGARLFEINATEPRGYKTWMRFSDLTTE